jgi:hypothetical protein
MNVVKNPFFQFLTKMNLKSHIQTQFDKFKNPFFRKILK